ncbi:MAG: response regulator transcription factor [Anaerolineales bacterium]|nr:response regulator transcription factor [Anaerolineales bacterium]
MIKIVLADDHQIVRQGLRALLQAEADFDVIGEASTGVQAIQLVERFKPDVLVTDMLMPELNGIEVTRQSIQYSPVTQVVVLSMHANEAYVVQALQVGAKGYVLKESSLEELVQAVRSVYRGQRYLSAKISEQTLELYLSREKAATLSDPYEKLTNREREILQMVAEGLSSVDIGESLVISSRTVESHRANLMRKLGLKNQAEVIHFALKRGLILLDE